MENIYGPWGNGVDAFLRRDYTGAERYFKSASPSSKICFNLGMSLMLQCRYQEAISAFNQALEFDDWMAISYFQRGNCFFMMGQYDNAILSWHDATTNIRHGEVVNYDSLHLSYMLCKSEIALNVAIAFYYCDMPDECNVKLDEARGFTIVKDDIPAITQQMIGQEDIYPCTVDDTTLFNPPKLPQSVIDAMKRGNNASSSWGSNGSSGGNSAPSYTPPPPQVSTSPTMSMGFGGPAKLAPPARTAPTPGSMKKTSYGGLTSGAPPMPNMGGAPSVNLGGPPPMANNTPPPPPKKAPKKTGGPPKVGVSGKKAPPKVSSPPPFGAPGPLKSPLGVPPSGFGASSGGPAPPPPPIPSTGIPQRPLPTSDESSSSGSNGSGASASPFSTDLLRDALARRNASANGFPMTNAPKPTLNSTSSTTTPPMPTSAPRPTPPAMPKVSSSPAASSTSPTAAPGSFKINRNPPPTTRIAFGSVNNANAEPNPTSPRNGNSPRSGTAPSTNGFAFKVLAEQGSRKKKIEVSVSTPAELRTHIAQAFGVDESTLIEHYDPDFGEFVELDNGVNLSSLPNMLKARVQ